MLIKDIRYRKLKALAKKYAKKNNIDDTNRNISNLDLTDTRTFVWDESPEGRYFWDLVNYGNYKEARKIFDWDVVQKHINKVTPQDKEDAIEWEEVFNPQPHYDNSKGSLYKVATERGWNTYLFDVVKRIERGGKKENNPLRQEIEKSIDVLKIWLNELPNE